MQGNAGPECRNNLVTREGKGLEISGVKSRREREREREVKRGRKVQVSRLFAVPTRLYIGLGTYSYMYIIDPC